MRERAGFTLTELVTTAAILAILAGAAIPIVKVAVQRDKEIELRRSLRTIREAIDVYKKMADEKKIETEDETDGYPPDLETLVKGVPLKSGEGQGGEESSKERIVKFLRRIPIDPMTKNADWGLRSTQDDPDSISWDEENVFDVYSKSRRIALDGSKYADW